MPAWHPSTGRLSSLRASAFTAFVAVSCSSTDASPATCELTASLATNNSAPKAAKRLHAKGSASGLMKKFSGHLSGSRLDAEDVGSGAVGLDAHILEDGLAILHLGLVAAGGSDGGRHTAAVCR